MSFELHPRLAADTTLVLRWSLSCVLLMNDRRWPWLILVPEQPDLSELHDLSPADRTTLMEEIAHASAALKQTTQAEKINVGALGNLVPQLHVHVVARRCDDPAWPGPIWGVGKPEPYGDDLDIVRQALKDGLQRD